MTSVTAKDPLRRAQQLFTSFAPIIHANEFRQNDHFSNLVKMHIRIFTPITCL